MATGLKRIAELVKTKPKQKLQTLVHLINKDSIKESHKKLDGNKASGVDRETKAEYDVELEKNVAELIERMKRQAYKPQPAKRVYIHKAGSDKMRPLGIPSYEDKLVQDVIAQILNEIYEPEFLNFSYGFRPRRSCHDAVKELGDMIVCHKTNYIVDADIKGFFDNVNHEWMMKFLEKTIADPNLLRLIKRFLKAGIVEEGIYIETDKGTPQGGVIIDITNSSKHLLALFIRPMVREDNKEKVQRRSTDCTLCG